MNGGAGHSGIVNLQGGTITGGTFVSDPTDPGSFIQATNDQTTLDGTNGEVILGAGNTLRIVPTAS